jgi:hypothetical protein
MPLAELPISPWSTQPHRARFHQHNHRCPSSVGRTRTAAGTRRGVLDRGGADPAAEESSSCDGNDVQSARSTSRSGRIERAHLHRAPAARRRLAAQRPADRVARQPRRPGQLFDRLAATKCSRRSSAHRPLQPSFAAFSSSLTTTGSPPPQTPPTARGVSFTRRRRVSFTRRRPTRDRWPLARLIAEACSVSTYARDCRRCPKTRFRDWSRTCAPSRPAVSPRKRSQIPIADVSGEGRKLHAPITQSGQ